MINKLGHTHFNAIYNIINDGASAYKGVIPADMWHDPYMSKEELKTQISAGVNFFGYFEDNDLLGVMGVQIKEDVSLIRHAYIRTQERNKGIGRKLLIYLTSSCVTPILIGTWADASWAIRFYEKHGFKSVSNDEKDHLLRKYWTIPELQVDTSIVLADENWFKSMGGLKP